jgi:hypothetical protein
VRHPEICLPKDVKETFFFDKNYDKGLPWYKWHFKHKRAGQLVGEVGPTYFDITELPNRVKEVNEDCKILITLRNPVDKARSLYHHKIGYGKLDGNTSFFDAVDQFPRIITSGYYAEHINRWYKVFGEENLFFYFLDDVKERPEELLIEIFGILNVKTSVNFETLNTKINESDTPVNKYLARYTADLANYLRSLRLYKLVEFGKYIGLKRMYKGKGELPELKRDDVERLHEIFEEHIQFVERKLNVNLNDWRYF